MGDTKVVVCQWCVTAAPARVPGHCRPVEECRFAQSHFDAGAYLRPWRASSKHRTNDHAGHVRVVSIKKSSTAIRCRRAPEGVDYLITRTSNRRHIRNVSAKELGDGVRVIGIDVNLLDER